MVRSLVRTTVVCAGVAVVTAVDTAVVVEIRRDVYEVPEGDMESAMYP